MRTHQENISAGVANQFGPVWLHSAAILHDGKIYAGVRHYAIMDKMQNELKVKDVQLSIAGFITNQGRFVNGNPAMAIAEGNGQLKDTHRRWAGRVMPEDLWSAFGLKLFSNAN